MQGTDALAQVARDCAPATPELTDAILDRLRGTVPEFFADPDVAFDMAAAVRANVGRTRQLLERGSLSAEGAPIEAADLLESTLQHGIPLISLLDAYRSAQAIALDWWQRRLEAALEPRRRGAATHALNELLVGYIDAAAAQIRGSYEQQRRELETSQDGRRAHLIRRLLAGEPLDIDAAARTLNHPLAARHVAVVIWRTGDGAPFADALNAIAATVGQVRVLTFPATRQRMYAWLSSSGRLDPAALRGSELPDGVIAAVSGVQAGIDGFVAAHEDALRTAALVRTRATTEQIVLFDQFELVALLSRDPDERDRFVRRVLGRLASADAAARETLRVYLACGSSPGRTAARLGVHRNTVNYRINALADLLPSDDVGRLELELALHIVDQLGPLG